MKLLLKKMRQCRLNFADNRYDCEAGIIGEHYATELIVTPPAIMPTEAVYRLCFEPGGLSEIILQTTDGAFSYPLPSAVTATPYCCVTLIGYVGSEQIYKSRMVRLHFSQTADGDADIDPQQPGIIAEVNRNTAARHSHDNKSVLDKFAESKDGKPTYGGEALGGGGGAWYVDITQSDDAATANKTAAEVYAAYEAGYSVYARILIKKYPVCDSAKGSCEKRQHDIARLFHIWREHSARRDLPNRHLERNLVGSSSV